jgi:hypothetical protein
MPLVAAIIADVSLKRVIKISVTPSAKTIIEGFAEKHGMKEIQVASRIYEWFTQQDDVLRKGVLGLLPEGYEPDVAKLALERLAADGKKPRKSA